MAAIVYAWMLMLTFLNVDYSASIEMYSLSISYFDEVAQSYCAAKSRIGFAFAVRRDCRGIIAPTCNDICKTVKNEAVTFLQNGLTTTSCFDAIHLYKKHPVLRANPEDAQPDDQRLSMASYGYGIGGCTWKPNHCGPNYCCCKAT